MQKWKRKIELPKMMAGLVDRRSVNGLRKQVNRMVESGDAEAFRLKNFLRLVEQAEMLNVPHLNSMSEHELVEVIRNMKNEEVEFPWVTRKHLVHRRVKGLTDAGDWMGLLMVLQLVGGEPFDALTPTLSTVSDNAKDKAQLLELYVVKNVIIKLVKQGVASETQLRSFLDYAEPALQHVDLVELESPIAVVVDQCICCCRALRALMSPTIDLSLQVSVTCNPCWGRGGWWNLGGQSQSELMPFFFFLSSILHNTMNCSSWRLYFFGCLKENAFRV